MNSRQAKKFKRAETNACVTIRYPGILKFLSALNVKVLRMTGIPYLNRTRDNIEFFNLPMLGKRANSLCTRLNEITGLPDQIQEGGESSDSAP